MAFLNHFGNSPTSESSGPWDLCKYLHFYIPIFSQIKNSKNFKVSKNFKNENFRKTTKICLKHAILIVLWKDTTRSWHPALPLDTCIVKLYKPAIGEPWSSKNMCGSSTSLILLLSFWTVNSVPRQILTCIHVI